MPAEPRIILVTRRTRLEELQARFNTLSQAKFYLERLGADFADYQAEHLHYQEQARICQDALKRSGRVQTLERRFLPNFLFGVSDLVVVLGQDGLVANTLKYLDGQAVIGVNPDRRRVDGPLLPFTSADLPRIVPQAAAGTCRLRDVTMARADFNTGEVLYAVNDFFIGARTHVSARYRLDYGETREAQSSSGIVVSTGLGSSGWYRSLMTGAAAIAGKAPSAKPAAVPWNANVLLFTVREPFPTRVTGATVVTGQIETMRPFAVASQMAEEGVVFSDGIESDFVAFNAPAMVRVTVAERRGKLVAA